MRGLRIGEACSALIDLEPYDNTIINRHQDTIPRHQLVLADATRQDCDAEQSQRVEISIRSRHHLYRHRHS